MDKNFHIAKDDFEYEEKVLKQLAAFDMMRELGIEEASIMYSEFKAFLQENQNSDYLEVKRMLLEKLAPAPSWF